MISATAVCIPGYYLPCLIELPNATWQWVIGLAKYTFLDKFEFHGPLLTSVFSTGKQRMSRYSGIREYHVVALAAFKKFPASIPLFSPLSTCP